MVCSREVADRDHRGRASAQGTFEPARDITLTTSCGGCSDGRCEGLRPISHSLCLFGRGFVTWVRVRVRLLRSWGASVSVRFHHFSRVCALRPVRLQ